MKIVTKRKSDVWVSNNRVLVGGSKKVTGRNPNFDADETKLLISIWGDPKVQKTLITTHKKHAVIAKLAERMREYGYTRSAEEINTRIKNLKCFYNRIKKDHEIAGGVNTLDPTWKHFNAMDEIMTRPIFSVRPNEIPKPSLRYKLEEARREREEKLADGGSSDGVNNNRNNDKINVDSDDDNLAIDDDDDDMIVNNMHDDDSNDNNQKRQSLSNAIDDDDFDDDKEMAECVEEKPKLKELDKLLEEDFKNTNSNSSSEVEDVTVNVKDEPIEVDDDDTQEKEKDEDETDMFPLSEYIKMSNNNASKTNNTIITTIATTLTNNTNPIVTSTHSQLKLSQPTTLVLNSSGNKASAVVTQSPQGKISLVPTNFLMKPTNHQQIQLKQTQPQQNFQLTTKPHQSHSTQHRIIYAPTAQQQKGGIVNNGPMKVLLVNTLQKNNQSGTLTSPTQTATVVQQSKLNDHLKNKTIFATTTTAQQTLQQAAVNQLGMAKTATVNLSNMVSSANVDNINLLGSSSKGTPTGYRALLGQLIKVQVESNEINRQRLHLEKERLKFEQTTADKFFANMTSMFTSIMQHQMQLSKEHEQKNKSSEFTSSSQKQDANANPNRGSLTKENSFAEDPITLELLIPKTEKEG